MNIAIKPITIDGQTVNTVGINVDAVRLNDSAELHIDFLNDKGTVEIQGQTVRDREKVTQKQIVLAGEEYNRWNEDQYIIDFVLTKYSLVKA